MNIKWERLAAIAVCIAAAVGLLWLGGRLILSILLPFLIAWLLSLCITPLSERFARRLRLPPRLCAAIFLTVTLSLSVWLIGASVNRLLAELRGLIERFADGSALFEMMEKPFALLERMTARIGLFEQMGMGQSTVALRERLNDMVSGMLEKLLLSIGAELPRAAAGILAAMPSVLLFLTVTVIAGFYLCMDRQQIERAVASVIPLALKERLLKAREGFRQVSWRYLRAYLTLLLLTLAELFVGFCALRVDYPLLLAILISIVDLLPVLGVGTVLVPWAAVALIQRNFYLGFGLLILWLAVMLLRQVLEARLIGKSLGLHPLLSLLAGYAGWKCFGVIGMALGPVVAMLAKSLLTRLHRSE